MIKVSVRVKYPDIGFVLPYRLVDSLSLQAKERTIGELNGILKNIERWTSAERNYSS
jgi:hypothetical protein